MWLNENNTWTCEINYNYLKTRKNFIKEEHAAWWYDQLALKYHGLDAKINGILKPDDFNEPVEKIKILPKGISQKGKKYQARFQGLYIGLFNTIEEGVIAYNTEKEKLQTIIQTETESEIEIERNQDGVAVIKTAKNEEFLVDDNKYHDLIKYSWCNDGKGYAKAKINGRDMYIHRFLMNATKNVIIDHINNNSYDNRMSNLRNSNKSLNNHNSSKKKNATSDFYGVSYDKNRSKYTATVSKNGKCYNLGRFATEEEAAKVRDKKAIELYGKYAQLNFPITVLD